MNVYAEYFIENNLSFRTNTILQFGDNWELIGNIVLANPGSAEPLREINDNERDKLTLFYKKYRNRIGDKFNQKNWYKFTDDQTMRFVEKIFNGSYLNISKNLNGVIQLFNTFNIKNQYLTEAINQINIDSNILFSKGIEKYFHDKPTYFGFSNEVLNNKILRDVAKDIFDNSSEKIKNIYNSDFSKNSFYHPMYINRAFKQNHFQWYKYNVLKSLIS